MQVNNDDTECPAETDSATLCSRGSHQLRLDEEIGIICRHCSYVHLEIKHILPSFVSHTDLVFYPMLTWFLVMIYYLTSSWCYEPEMLMCYTKFNKAVLGSTIFGIRFCYLLILLWFLTNNLNILCLESDISTKKFNISGKLLLS